jgi:hypothetical protein
MKKVLLSTVCAVVCTTNVGAMHRVAQITGHLVPQQGSSEEYSRAHANALRFREMMQDLEKNTQNADLKKPNFSELHVKALELLVETSLSQDDVRTEDELIQFFKRFMYDNDFRRNVYMYVRKMLAHKDGVISDKFETFLISFDSESQTIIKRCSSVLTRLTGVIMKAGQ